MSRTHQESISIQGDCPTIYGPVPSRRHGLSLGLNLGAPSEKVCTWGCVYCQCGMGRRGRPGLADGVPSALAILASFRAKILESPELDSVTLAGNSEPTAHPEFPFLVDRIRALRDELGGKWIFNCLSNGSELGRDEIVEACDALDESWIKLDSATDELFRRLNRPIREVGDIAQHLDRISRLKEPRIQTLLWKSPSDPRLGNFTELNLAALIRAYDRLHPCEIHLTTLSRETAVRGLQAISESELERFAGRVAESGHSVRFFP